MIILNYPQKINLPVVQTISVNFLLNESSAIEAPDETLPPCFTLLDYLRIKRNITGTKEGCCSGDCGACTVLVGSLASGGINYTAINSCITPLSAVEGKHVVTVEHLSSSGALHPAQYEMVACNGSQCGFCTPGFVMSLAGLYERKQAIGQGTVSRQEVCDAISGNLCRCTGYKPIVEAGLAMQFHEGKNSRSLYTQQQFLGLKAREANSTVSADYLQPQSLDELDGLIEQNSAAVIIAGGTDLMLRVTQNYEDISTLIDVSRVAEMKELRNTEHSTLIGAAVSYAELEAWFKTTSPQFNSVLERLGSRQIRNRGTIGGNIANASPIADTPPILLALCASLHLRKCDGSERVVPISEFYLDYKHTVLAVDEYIREIDIPLQNLSHFHRFYKVSKRFEDDISSVMAAIAFDVKDGLFQQVTIAFGGVAATPVRNTQAETVFLNKAVSDESVLQEALEIIRATIKPIDDVRASAEYRLDMAMNLVHKAWLELNEQAVPELYEREPYGPEAQERAGHSDA